MRDWLEGTCAIQLAIEEEVEVGDWGGVEVAAESIGGNRAITRRGEMIGPCGRHPVKLLKFAYCSGLLFA